MPGAHRDQEPAVHHWGLFTFPCLLASPHAIMALFCVVSSAWRLSWGVFGWIWLCGSTVSLAGDRESHGSASPWNAEPALVRAPPLH